MRDDAAKRYGAWRHLARSEHLTPWLSIRVARNPPFQEALAVRLRKLAIGGEKTLQPEPC
jgi:hypothetical protein